MEFRQAQFVTSIHGVVGKVLKMFIVVLFALQTDAFGTNAELGIAEQLITKIEEGAFSSSQLSDVRVRIPIVLTSYKTIQVKGVTGESGVSSVPQIPEQHVLRARIDKPNQFYVGDYRVETNPKRLLKKTARYVVQLDIYRRYGEFGQLEEFMGSLDLIGTLRRQEEKNLFVLDGIGKRKFRDRNGLAILDLTAGNLSNNQNKSNKISSLDPNSK